ncbi:hypothetical protein [Halococcus sp. AFM35]|uniref:hypothetical protein n=1 Tax=Halococcus sp. AFM35 TaxID=3421653 RepID=UPI003EBA2F0C
MAVAVRSSADEGRATGGVNGVNSEGRFASLGQPAWSAGDAAKRTGSAATRERTSTASERSE